MRLEACANCKVEYPEGYLNPIHTSFGVAKDVCGICALDISNKLHGTRRKRFKGPIAEEARQKALRWREEHK